MPSRLSAISVTIAVQLLFFCVFGTEEEAGINRHYKPTSLSPNTIKHFISNTNQSLSLNSSFPNKRLSRYKPTFSPSLRSLNIIIIIISRQPPRIQHREFHINQRSLEFTHLVFVASLYYNTNQRSLGADPSESLSPPICFLRRNTSALQQLSSSSSVEA